MNAITIFTEIVLPLLGTGSLIYLLVDKLLATRPEKANIHTQIISDSNEVADLYLKIDEIVESKTAPIKEELIRVTGELVMIKEHWCCYKEGCMERIIHPQQQKMIQEYDDQV